jgi:aminoglycoside phosphotransferase (APT) family kinase protein
LKQDTYRSLVSLLYPDAQLDAMVRLTGGVSADVHRLDLKWPDGRAQQLVLRAHGASHSGHAAELEYQLLQALHDAGVLVPKPIHVDASGSLLPDPFLLMAFVEGSTAIPVGQELHYIDAMAAVLAGIHSAPVHGLPTLPIRSDPLSDVFEYLPEGTEWVELRAYLGELTDTGYEQTPKLLHGDFWPENLLWRGGAVAAILDWEDAALGDPLADVAGCRVELRYKFGQASMQLFTQAYAKHQPVDLNRLALWQVYVAAAAQRYMGGWGLEPTLEAHMRVEALASIREAGALLMS